MRLHLYTNASKRILPFNYQNRLTGAIHKWLGPENAFHGQQSMFSFSWLQGGKPHEKNGLTFPQGARWFISAHDPEFLKLLLQGIQRDPLVTEDLYVNRVDIQEDPTFGQVQVFRVSSPVLVKYHHREVGKTIHHVFSEEVSDQFLTESFQRKLAKAGIASEGVRVNFFRNYPGARAKVIYYDGIGNRVNFCPVVVSGTSQQLAFAWNAGVGNSTGIGFGSLQ